MTKAEEQTIRNLIARLEKPRLGAGEGYGEETRNSRIYVDTWGIGPLKMLLPESRNPELSCPSVLHQCGKPGNREDPPDENDQPDCHGQRP